MRDSAEIRGCLSRTSLKAHRSPHFAIFTTLVLLLQAKTLCWGAEASPQFEFHDGDRVVLIGDTPAGESRASFDFDKPEKGFEKIKEELTGTQPTVIIVGYGMASSFAGQPGLAAFTKNLNRLLDTAKTVCTNHSLRFILLSPIRHEDLGPPLPNPREHNRDLALYVKAIE